MTCHVLIIEDDPLAALDIEVTLQRHGATSFAVSETEEDAVEEASRHRPDIIASDVRLRIGTGPDAVRAIRKALGPLPVIFVTGSPEECDMSDASMRVLSKPVQEGVLAKAFLDLSRSIDTH